MSASVFFQARELHTQRHFRLLQWGKMAAVVDRVDGCVGSMVSDAVSLIQSIPLPDQSNPLLGLPIVAIETILSFLSYDEISLLRSVRTKTSPPDWETLVLDVFKALILESCILCVATVIMTSFMSQVKMYLQCKIAVVFAVLMLSN